MTRRGRWSVGELATLREFYGIRSETALARSLGRSVESVRKMADQVFRGIKRTGPWSADEVMALKKSLGISPPEVIAKRLRRTPTDVLTKISSLGRRNKKGPWTPEEIQVLKQIYGSRSDQDLGLILGRSESSIRTQASQLCLSKDKGFLRKKRGDSVPMPRWSKEQEKTLRTLYEDHSNLEIARVLKKSVKSIVSKAHDLGLKKGDRRLRSMGRENVAQRRDR